MKPQESKNIKSMPQAFWTLVKQSNNILDVGAGNGTLMTQIKKISNTKIMGVDAEPVNKFIKKASIYKLPFKKEQFDFVYSKSVFEHLVYPLNAMKEINRITKKGGFVYIQTPYIATMYFPNYCNFWIEPDHVRPHSKESLIRLLEYSEFKVIDCKVKRLDKLYLIPYLVVKSLFSKKAFHSLLSQVFGQRVYIIGKKTND